MKSDISLTPATLQDIGLIRKIAKETWPDAFSAILPEEQIEYMLKMMYDTTVLENQMNQSEYYYYLINKTEGFAAIEIDYIPSLSYAKIHKLYIHPRKQSSGLGRKSIDFLISIALKYRQQGLILNVNKLNNATHFYEKTGFRRWKSEVVDIGNDYVMDDYVYRMIL